MARLSWLALLEQNHVQMVSPYFSQPRLTAIQPQNAAPRTQNPGLRPANSQLPDSGVGLAIDQNR